MVKEYGGKVRVVYKNFVVHPDAVMDAHLAGCAAAKQGKFPAYYKTFWEKGFGAYKQSRDPASMNADAIAKMAGEVGIDVAKLQADMKSDECKQLVSADMAELNKFGINGTPSFFVNGKFTMFSDPAAFKAMIDKEIAEAEASGKAEGYYENVVMKEGEKKFRSKKDAKGG